MSDYTPTTEEVRDAVAYDGDFYESNGDWIVLRDDIAACFDRWLAAHDQETCDRAVQRVIDAAHAMYLRDPHYTMPAVLYAAVLNAIRDRQ